MDATHTKKHTKERVKHAKDVQESTSEVLQLGRGFDQVSDPVIITDKGGNILYANKALKSALGYTAKEAIGKKPGHLWGGAMETEFYKKMWQTIEIEKKPFVGEVRNKRKDGTLIWQEVHISPILDEEGRIKFFISIQQDITERKEKEKIREEFEAVVSHQIRNPLQTIGLMTEILLKSGTLTQEDKENVKTISVEDKELSNFITDLSTISKLGHEGLSQELLDIGHLIEKIISDVRAAHPDVAISYTKKTHGFPLTVNRSLAIQVFSNLIYNAAEYSDGMVDIVLEKDASSYAFSCHNDGLEISPKNAPRIFTKLFRSDTARQRKEGGTGLGLYIVKTITESLSWDVWFESAAGRGTTFNVKIPL